jgi:hypothetical protein
MKVFFLTLLIVLIGVSGFAKPRTCGPKSYKPGSNPVTLTKDCETVFGIEKSTKVTVDSYLKNKVTWKLLTTDGEYESWINLGAHQNKNDEYIVWSPSIGVEPRAQYYIDEFCGDGTPLNDRISINWGDLPTSDEFLRAEEMGLSEVVPQVKENIFWTYSIMDRENAILFNGKTGKLGIEPIKTPHEIMCVLRVKTEG